MFLILINALTTVQSEGIKDDGGSLNEVNYSIDVYDEMKKVHAVVFHAPPHISAPA